MSRILIKYLTVLSFGNVKTMHKSDARDRLMIFYLFDSATPVKWTENKKPAITRKAYAKNNFQTTSSIIFALPVMGFGIYDIKHSVYVRLRPPACIYMPVKKRKKTHFPRFMSGRNCAPIV